MSCNGIDIRTVMQEHATSEPWWRTEILAHINVRVVLRGQGHDMGGWISVGVPLARLYSIMPHAMTPPLVEEDDTGIDVDQLFSPVIDRIIDATEAALMENQTLSFVKRSHPALGNRPPERDIRSVYRHISSEPRLSTAPSREAAEPKVLEIVAANDKKRLTMKRTPEAADSGENEESDMLRTGCRANQAHSIKIESAGLLRKRTAYCASCCHWYGPALEGPRRWRGHGAGGATALEDMSGNTETVKIPRMVAHGTYIAFWRAIVESGGLMKMGRHHPVDGEKNTEPEVKSGMRRDAGILARCLEDKAMLWWLTSMGVPLARPYGIMPHAITPHPAPLEGDC